jgi:hypothetical protein
MIRYMVIASTYRDACACSPVLHGSHSLQDPHICGPDLLHDTHHDLQSLRSRITSPCLWVTCMPSGPGVQPQVQCAG